MQTKMTKSAIVRQVLKEIGAVHGSPDGWMQTVQNAIAKREGTEKDKTINKITIYQIRRQLREQEGLGKKKSQETATPELNIETLQAISILAKKIGGIEILSQGVSILQSLK